ncbi:hypothetical protein CAEBREN_30092 [Caenorhabditis brenneri]|uniref:TIL domain-containing protein n=1 Tax=Caenorhabditis brenneri TaxID=135651 RepID=G0PDH7_CAEBE|nr:hypothetical protein CAEBREN_30092 [Caenorhabditis brenneri]
MIKTEFLAAFFVMVAAVSAQVPPGGGVGPVGPGAPGSGGGGGVGPGSPACNGNETFTSCQKCDAYCTNLTYTCQEECSAGCLCNPGYVRDLQNKCIKIEDCPKTVVATDCSTKKCTTPGGCAMVQPLNCATPKCAKIPKCVNENQCLYTRCPRGFQCVLQESSGSDPVAQCV